MAGTMRCCWPSIILANCISRSFEGITHLKIRYFLKARSARSHDRELSRSDEKRLFPGQIVCDRSEIVLSGALAITTDAVLNRGLSTGTTLRDDLRSSTHDVHERLHRHRGLAAVQAGTIDLKAYTALLCRLYGFHRPFEVATRLTPHRTIWLESDLEILGVDANQRAALPHCAATPEKALCAYILGARYVVEGSALGGRGLARQLDDLLGPGVIAGRRFFTGHGSATGAVWREYLARLSAVPSVGPERAAVVAGAIQTFAIFEQWLGGWDEVYE